MSCQAEVGDCNFSARCDEDVIVISRVSMELVDIL